MYWTDWERTNPRVMRADLDGNNVEVLVSEGLTLPSDITIDPYFRKACILDGGKESITFFQLRQKNTL